MAFKPAAKGKGPPPRKGPPAPAAKGPPRGAPIPVEAEGPQEPDDALAILEEISGRM